MERDKMFYVKTEKSAKKKKADLKKSTAKEGMKEYYRHYQYLHIYRQDGFSCTRSLNDDPCSQRQSLFSSLTSCKPL